jgi:short-subunit dehydrogenase
MTKDHAKNPLFAKPQGVAQGIVEAMDARKHEAFVPGIWAAIMPIVKMTPEALFQRVSALSGR